ncbi:MAG: histidine phosphatase family protein [Clostridiales bacterium]|nr:histidine phosphatase family protein [Clostridiales bacterium]
MRLIFVRHAEPNYEKDTLTEKGWREARLLAKRMANVKMDEVYVSPLGRAQDTWKETQKLTGQTAQTCDWLREFFVPITDPVTGKERIAWDFYPGYWTGVPQLYDKDTWMDSELMLTGRVREEYEKVAAGIDGVLKDHGYERYGNYYKVTQANKDTLVFYCHFGVICVMLSHLCGVAAPVLWQQFFMAPTALTTLYTEERVAGEACFRVKQFGDTAHLYVAGERESESGFFEEVFESK